MSAGVFTDLISAVSRVTTHGRQATGRSKVSAQLFRAMAGDHSRNLKKAYSAVAEPSTRGL
jgi:hypothetical protein